MLSPAPADPAAVIAEAGEVLAPLHARLWPAATDEQLLDGIQALTVLQAEVAAVEALLLAEIAERDLPRKQLSWASPAEWYAHLAVLTLRDARATVEHAPLLVGERDATLHALTAGAISANQADVVCRAVEQLPLSPSLRARGERALLEEAGHLNATDLRRTADHLVETVDPTAPAHDPRDHGTRMWDALVGVAHTPSTPTSHPPATAHDPASASWSTSTSSVTSSVTTRPTVVRRRARSPGWGWWGRTGRWRWVWRSGRSDWSPRPPSPDRGPPAAS